MKLHASYELSYEELLAILNDAIDDKTRWLSNRITGAEALSLSFTPSNGVIVEWGIKPEEPKVDVPEIELTTAPVKQLEPEPATV